MKMAIKWLSGCLTILLAAACQPSITQTKMASSPSPAQRVQAACKNLHKVVDIDDLLKQMYDNLDSQCLFEMPTAELEKIWGIRIFDFVKQKPEKFIGSPEWQQLVNQEMEFRQTENSLFLVKAIKNIDAKQKTQYFQIWASNLFAQQHDDSFGGSLQKFALPKLLPNPNNIQTEKQETWLMVLPSIDKQTPLEKKRQIKAHHYPNNQYAILSSYIWLNAKAPKNQHFPYLEIGTGYYPAVSYIILYQNFYSNPKRWANIIQN